MRALIVSLFLFSLTACASGPVGNPAVPEPAKAVDLDRYLGKWYELARYENGFEKNCENVTAEYARCEDDQRICIINTCMLSSDQSTNAATGKAKIVDGSRNAKLKVSFWGPFYVGDYWVLDHAPDYSWSIVGEPSGRYLWILTRPKTLPTQKREELVRKAESLGYDTSLLHYTKQN